MSHLAAKMPQLAPFEGSEGHGAASSDVCLSSFLLRIPSHYDFSLEYHNRMNFGEDLDFGYSTEFTFNYDFDDSGSDEFGYSV